MKRLKHVAEIIAGQSPSSDDVTPLTGGLPFIQGNAEFGALSPSARYECFDPPKRARRGDLLVSVRAPVGAVNVADRQYGIGRGLCAVRPRDIDPGFLRWWVLDSAPYLNTLATGTTFTAISASVMGSMALPCDDPRQQRAVSDYLAREVAQIDTLMKNQERLIETLRERRHAVVRRVISGRGPSQQAVRLGYCARVGSGDGIALEDVTRSSTATRPVPVIGGNGVMGYTDRSNVKGSVIAIGRVGALCGNAHRVDGPAWITDNALRLNGLSGFDVDYLRWCLESMDLNAMSRSTAQPLITGTQVAALRVDRPPLEEQRAVADALDHQTAKIHALIAKAEQFIALARERRSALITAAVAGQIDVRAAS